MKAIVIGSGFGGAVAACRLSQAGFDTLILERGRRYEAADFPPMPPAKGLLPEGRRLAWVPNHGLCDVQDLDEVISIQAAGYGGGSLIYANVALRPPAELLDVVDKQGQRVWPKPHSRETLDPFFDLVGSMLDVAPITTHTAGLKLVKTEQLARASRALGREAQFFYPPLAVSRSDATNAHGQEQAACKQCGACVTGCPHRAKNTLDLNYLAVAEKNGAKVRTQCEVIRIERRNDPNNEKFIVHCIDHLTSEWRHEEADLLFLCAGAVHSTRLLAGADLRLGSEKNQYLRDRVGLGYYPNADAIGVIFETTHPQYPSWGPTITGTTMFPRRATDSAAGSNDDPARHWFMIQDGGYDQQLARMIGMVRSPLWAGRNRFPATAAASVPPSSHAPDPLTMVEGAPPLPSVLDRVLQAKASGLFAKATPQQLSDAAPKLIDAVSDQLLPPVVADTIDRAVRDRFGWVRRYLGDWFFRKTVCFLKWVAHGLGKDKEIARHAARAALTLGGQSAADVAKTVGYTEEKANHRAMLLAMGPDPSAGALLYHPSTQTVTADLDLYHQAPLYQDQELAMRDIARSLGGELRLNPAWSFLGKPITVHSQGGCRMSEDPDVGVTDPNGQVWNCPGLYVMDGACLPASVGVNPSSTIAAIAERNVLEVIKSKKADWLHSDHPGAVEYRKHRDAAAAWRDQAKAQGWNLEPPKPGTNPPTSEPIGLAFDEHMQGFVATPLGPLTSMGMEDIKQAYRALEIRGRPQQSLDVKLTAQTFNMARFLEDEKHILTLTGQICVRLPGDDQVREYLGEGALQLLVPRRKQHVLRERAASVQRKIARSYVSSAGEQRSTRLMRYTLNFKDQRGQTWELRGYKHISDDAGADAWRDTTELFVKLSRRLQGHRRELVSAGVIHMDMTGFVNLVHTMRLVTPSSNGPMKNPDAARVAWTLISFSHFFFGNLQRIYLPQLQQMVDALMRPAGSRQP